MHPTAVACGESEARRHSAPLLHFLMNSLPLVPRARKQELKVKMSLLKKFSEDVLQLSQMTAPKKTCRIKFQKKPKEVHIPTNILKSNLSLKAALTFIGLK